MIAITDECFNSINKYISIHKSNEKDTIQHTYGIIDQVTRHMKSIDCAFDYMCTKEVLAGSYADDLKIDKPDEFDYILRFKLPFANKIKITESKIEPGYVQINANKLTETNEPNLLSVLKIIRPFINSNGHLLKSKVFNWFQKLFENFLLTLPRSDRYSNRRIIKSNGENCEIWYNINGPAVTINVFIPSKNYNFSLDLVIALELDEYSWTSKRRYEEIWRGKWNVVPKPSDFDENWMCSYAQLERKYLLGRNKCKPLIRYFKKMRDTHNLTNLKSYYIKTVFLWELYKTDGRYWERKMFNLFYEMLEKIIISFKNKQLLFFWDTNYNMLSKLTNAQTTDIANKLLAIKNKLDKNKMNSNIIKEILFTQSEIYKMNTTYPVSAQLSTDSTTSNSSRRLYYNFYEETDDIGQRNVTQIFHRCAAYAYNKTPQQKIQEKPEPRFNNSSLNNNHSTDEDTEDFVHVPPQKSEETNCVIL